jgi:hypothetical protein
MDALHVITGSNAADHQSAPCQNLAWSLWLHITKNSPQAARQEPPATSWLVVPAQMSHQLVASSPLQVIPLGAHSTENRVTKAIQKQTYH